MDTDLEKINELRSETQKLMRKLWEASQEYTPSTDLVMDVLQATQPPPVLPRMPPSPKKHKKPASPTKKQSIVSKPKLFQHSALGQQLKEEQNEQRIHDLFQKEDHYYDQLQSFRKTFADMFYTEKNWGPELEPMSQPTAESTPVVNQEQVTLSEQFVYNGYYETLPDLSLKSTSQSIFIEEEERRKELDPPVKVSILEDYIEKIPQVPKPHRRKSFDPSESIGLSAVTA